MIMTSKCVKTSIVSIILFSLLFSYVSYNRSASLEPIMMRALLENKPEFVRILLKCDVVMRHFLTFERLHQLYNNSHRRTGFLRCLHNHGLLNPTHSDKRSGIKAQKVVRLGTIPFPSNAMRRRIYLNTINRLMRKILRRFINRDYDQDTLAIHSEKKQWEKIRKLNFEAPFWDLFLWAILHQRQEMALLFWEHCEESIALALIACCLYTNMMEFIPDYDTETQMCYARYVDTFEELALSILEECDEADPDMTDSLLIRERPIWGGFSYLQLAFQSNRRKFISSRICQNSIHFAWCHGMRANIGIKLITLVFPFLLFSDDLIKWGEDQFLSSERDTETKYNEFHLEGIKSDPNRHGSEQDKSNYHADTKQTKSVASELRLSCCEKLNRFYCAPQTKFYLSALAYVVFLLYFSYTLMFATLSDQISVLEAILMAYFVAMAIDIIRQISISPGRRFQKFRYWWKNYPWNRAEFSIILFATVSMLLRIGLQNTFIEAKTFYVITLISSYIRVFGLYSLHANLGPKLVMIENMIQELLVYMFIILIVLIPFGVASQTLLYPYRTYFEWETIKYVFYYPYWNLFGELGLDFAMAESPTCANGTIGVDCPQFNFMVPFLLAVYVIIGSGLLMNLLIAIYSNVFDQIEEQSIELWKFSMYTMVVEYDKRPILPVPLSVFQALAEFIKYLIRKCICAEANTGTVNTHRRNATVIISIAKSPHSQNNTEEDDENYRDDGTNLFNFSNSNQVSNPALVKSGDNIQNDLESGKQASKEQGQKFLNFFRNLDLSEIHEDSKVDRSERQFEINCKRNVLKNQKLTKEKTLEVSINALEAKVDKILRSITDISDRIEMQTREKEDQAVEIKEKIVKPDAKQSLISLSVKEESPQFNKRKKKSSVEPLQIPVEKPEHLESSQPFISTQSKSNPIEPLSGYLEQTIKSTTNILLKDEIFGTEIKKDDVII